MSKKYPPPTSVNFHMKTAFSGRDGSLVSFLELRGYYLEYVAGGFFSSPYFEPFPVSKIFIFSALNNEFQYGIRKEDEIKSSPHKYPVVFNLPTMEKDFDRFKIYRLKIEDFSPWEIVNTHQWEGVEPPIIRNINSQVIGKAPPCWDIASSYRNERLVALRGHGNKNTVYSLNNHINGFFDYWKIFISQFKDDIEKSNSIGVRSVVDHKGLDTHDAVADLYNEMMKAYDLNPPPWEDGQIYGTPSP